ncbi:class I SAM-dependent methyltransferase [uncultured Bradyrhizobium sp.]|uniref:class I SAM-dependent methyltransferase n=1 Tax=uncultured Bradyrhizobium sp. TaxID=199684 RepID=UPI0035CBBBE3
MRDEVLYHQKAAIVDNVTRYIRDLAARSLLDIGAGGAETALPLSKLVDRYHAIEQNPHYAARLENAGLKVSRGTFPLALDETYDLVLSSHSVPELLIEPYAAFLSSAWRLTAPGGLLLVITFKGSRGDLAEVRQELLGEPPAPSEEHDTIMRNFQRLGGRVRTERVNSYVEARKPGHIASFLEPWLTQDPAMQASIHHAFTGIVETRYKVRDGLYVFPTQHLFISCRRQ